MNRPHYRLEEFLTGITPEDMRKAIDWGPDIGREIVEDHTEPQGDEPRVPAQ